LLTLTMSDYLSRGWLSAPGGSPSAASITRFTGPLTTAVNFVIAAFINLGNLNFPVAVVISRSSRRRSCLVLHAREVRQPPDEADRWSCVLLRRDLDGVDHRREGMVAVRMDDECVRGRQTVGKEIGDVLRRILDGDRAFDLKRDLVLREQQPAATTINPINTPARIRWWRAQCCR
jgi:hypothetical protein